MSIALLLCSQALIGAVLAENRVDERGTIDDDYYAAGGRIDIDAEINGDLIAAGGELMLGHRVAGDLLAAGGTLELRGEVLDDVRVAGGDIAIDAAIGDDLAASGGNIRLTRNSQVGGNAWLAGGSIEFAGTVDKDLKIRGGEIRFSGIVRGDVELDGGKIQFLDGARIEGDLIYRSAHQAERAADVQVGGRLEHSSGARQYADRGFGLVFSLTLVVASIMLYLFFPVYTRSAVRRVGNEPWLSLVLGFGFFILTPLVSILLMLILLGLWVGLCLLALYAVALLVGFLVACFFVSEQGARLVKQDLTGTGQRLIAVTIVIFILGLIQAVPLLGGLILFTLMLFGLGASLIQLRYVYRAESAAAQ